MGVVELHQVPSHYRQRPAIRGDVVVVDEQHMLVERHLEQPGPQQQTRRQIKRRAALVLLPFPDQLLGIPPPQLLHRQGKRPRRMNQLQHLAPLQLKRRTQGGMALDQPSQSPLQGWTIQITP